MKIYFVYILKCSDNTFYTGVTNNLERRLAEHSEGIDPFCYTAKRRPLELVFVQEFQEIKEAISFEKQIKGWSKKKKLAMINDEWDKLKELAVCKNETSHKNLKANLLTSKTDEKSS
ncbi:GIY-YIG nuclease family protein [uncultured Algoriphagus sp.]|uniref:GIY-YIG nuclease family protein n=1 Tax=uncultured Algoriphagus sp. TaxID=417365 RepID=UPI0030EF9E47|tara:strand:+ start:16 stop:366 length:351 start_codon:yes stop_codon:yes gene_type:complete